MGLGGGGGGRGGFDWRKGRVEGGRLVLEEGLVVEGVGEIVGVGGQMLV